MKVNDKIAALDRGLSVIRFMLLQQTPKRFKDFKSCFPEMTDATLTRLLKALIASGYLQRTEKGLYQIGSGLLEWKALLLGSAESIEAQVQDTVEKIAKATNCSASFIELDGDHLVFRHTHTLMDSWYLCPDGTVLYYEPDHAASMAFLDSLAEDEVEKCIASQEYSRIAGIKEYQRELTRCKRAGYFIDESRSRIGMSRCAVLVDHPQLKGVFFIGLATAELMIRESELVKIIKEQCELLADKLDKRD